MVAVLSAVVFPSPAPYKSVALRFVNADGVSLDSNGNVVRFAEFVVRDGRFVAVGAAGSGNTSISLPVVDLGGRTVLPGFIDGHAHLFALGEEALRAEISGLQDLAAVRAAVEAWIERRRVPPGAWVRGGRWSFDVGVPRMRDLDVSPILRLYRIALRRIDGHALWCNALALSAATLPATNPPGGEIVREANGAPTGVLVDTAQLLVPVPEATTEESEEALNVALRACAKFGITSVHSAGEPPRLVAVLERALALGRLSLRVYAMLMGEGETLPPREWCGSAFRDRGGFGRLSLRAVKLFADGSLGARGAWLLAPYSDAPNVTGLPKQPEGQLAEQTRAWAECGYQICTHAIGDAGVRATLDAYAAWLNGTTTDARFRVEHAQIVNGTDFDRFRRLKVLASMQPLHALSDAAFAEERVGPTRMLGAYAWRSMREAGVPLVLGSDFPVEDANPVLGLAAAVTRQAPGTSSPWYPAQRLTLNEALFGFTRGAAFGAFEENVTGAIEKGFFADFVVLNQSGWYDAVSRDPMLIWNTTVEQTWVGGSRVY